MNENPNWTEIIRLPIGRIQDVVLARFVGRELAAEMGFPPNRLTHLTAAISEITRNVIQHAGCPGVIQIARSSDAKRPGLQITVSDPGKGMDPALQQFEPTAPGALGTGLPGTRRLVDSFALHAQPGAGTTVAFEMWIGKEQHELANQIG